MARDDYFVIVYQVLKYLYDCLKKGERPDPDYLEADTFDIPKNYWDYILLNLCNEKYITGLNPKSVKGVNSIAWANKSEAIITPKGIEYLFENSMLQKVKRTLKDVKDIVPGI